MDDPQPGQTVTLVGLKAEGLNGVMGKVVRYDRSSGRYEVDLGHERGIKAIRLDNLYVPSEGGRPPGEGDDEDFQAGDLIGRLLGEGEDDRSYHSEEEFQDGAPPPGEWDGDRTEASRSPENAPEDFTGFSVKELKEFLKDRAVPTVGVTEKSELIDLCRKYYHAPLGPASEQDMRGHAGSSPPADGHAEDKKGSRPPSNGAAEPPPGQFTKAPDRGASPPAGSWAGPDAPPGHPGLPPQFGHPGWGAPPPGWGAPPPGFPYPPPGGYSYPPGYHQAPPGYHGPAPSAPSTGVTPAASAPRSPKRKDAPRSREDAMAIAEKRLATARPHQDTLRVIDRFVREFRLGDEVELGLRLITGENVRQLVGNPDVRKRVREASDRAEAILVEVGRLDPEAEAISRVLRSGGAKDGRKSSRAEPKDKYRSSKTAGDEGKHRSHRSRSRRRRRESPDLGGRGTRRRPEGERERRSDADRREHRDRRGETGRRGDESRRERRHGDRGAEPSDRHRRSRREGAARDAPGSSRGGVWDSPTRGAEAKPSSGAARQADAELERWVLDLDGGRGAFMKYLEPLKRDFGDLAALAASVLPQQVGNSVVGFIDVSVWPALGVEALGHKLTFAKGIVALAESLGMRAPPGIL